MAVLLVGAMGVESYLLHWMKVAGCKLHGVCGSCWMETLLPAGCIMGYCYCSWMHGPSLYELQKVNGLKCEF